MAEATNVAHFLSKNLFFKTKMFSFSKKRHTYHQKLRSISKESGGGEKREGKLLFVWGGGKGVGANILLNSSHKTGQVCDSKRLVTHRQTNTAIQQRSAGSTKIKEASERNQSRLKQNELGARDRVGGDKMRGEERRRGDIKQEG